MSKRPPTNQLPTTHYSLQTSEGQAVIFAVLVVGVLLSIGLTLSAIFLPKIRASSEIKKSSTALYAAESAIEWCLYVNRHGAVALPVMANSANYENALVKPSRAFVAGDCSGSQIRAIGTYQGISRTFEISF